MSGKILIGGFALILAHLFTSKQGQILWSAMVGINTPQPTNAPPLTGAAAISGLPALGGFLSGQPGIAGAIGGAISGGSAVIAPSSIGITDPRIANPANPNTAPLRINKPTTKPAWWPWWLPYWGQ